MIKPFRNLDAFSKNVLFVFAGTSLVNLFNLLCQVLIAHRLTPADFAAFNSLLSILILFSVPLGTLGIAVAKYSAEYNAQNQTKKIQILLSGLLKKVSFLGIFTFFIFYSTSFYIIDKLKIPSISAGYILAILLAVSWITPVFSGGLQGLELFKWLMSASLITGASKLVFAFVFIWLGFNIAGALGAFLVASFVGIIVSYLPLRGLLSFRIINPFRNNVLSNLESKISNEINSAGTTTNLTNNAIVSNEVDFKEIFFYLFPVIISYFCYLNLVSFDMVLIKYFFNPQDAGIYSLAQVVGKIFLFLPGAISIVMFPKISHLNAQKRETVSTLKKSLHYGLLLCLAAILIYNIFPTFILKALTGKAPLDSIRLGRLFSISMSFFALLYIIISYFVSLKDTRFIKYLVLFTVIQLLAIIFFHRSLMQVQIILCINAPILFFIPLILAIRKNKI